MTGTGLSAGGALFRALHAPGELLRLPNCWDVASAKLCERAGARAVATSSCALAWSKGFGDGERLPFPLLVDVVGHIARGLTVPLTVDLERGYGASAEEVARSVEQVVAAGAVGVNLEDGGGEVALHCARLQAVRQRVPQVFINARTDVVMKTNASVSEVAELDSTRDAYTRYLEHQAGQRTLLTPTTIPNTGQEDSAPGGER